MATVVLYGYERSSCTRRVRIALALKGIECDFRDVDLRAGDNRSEDYLRLNPQGQVPVLEIDGVALCQSIAILEYLEDTRPTPALLPATPVLRAQCRQVVEAVNSGIQPLQNVIVQQRVSDIAGNDEQAGRAWSAYWIDRGLAAVERVVAHTAGTYAMGDQVTLADVALAPQCYNAGLFDLDLARYPTLARVNAACLALPAFATALAG